MSRVLATLLICAAMPACSTADPSGELLSPVWSVAADISDYYATGERGGLDASHFYAVRGRSRSGGTRQLVAYRRSDGSVAWVAGVEQPCTPPVAAEGRVFCPAGSLFAFDAMSGRSLWTLPTDSSLQLVRGTVDAARVYAGSLTSTYAADAATGRLAWKRSYSGPWDATRNRSLTLTPEGDLLIAFDAQFIAGSRFSAAAVIAVDPATGVERWRFVDGDATTSRSPGDLTLSGDLVLYSDATGKEAVAFSRRTRQIVWRAPWTPGFIGTQRAPLVAEGVAYFTDGGGGAFAVDAATGTRRWATQPSTGGFFSHEVCGPVFLGNNGPVEVIDRADGRSRGRLFPDDETALMMATDGAQAFVSTTKGIYAFDCGA